METRYHIGLLTGTLLILAILSYAYYADYNYRKEIARTEQTEQQETEQTVSTQGGAHKEGVYYLKNRNGYVIVYLDDQRNDADDQNAELKQVGISDHNITPSYVVEEERSCGLLPKKGPPAYRILAAPAHIHAPDIL